MNSLVESQLAEIAEAESLRAEWKFAQLSAMLSKYERSELIARPELGSLLLLAMQYMGREDEAVELLNDLRRSPSIQPRSLVWFRIELADGHLAMYAGDLHRAESIYYEVQQVALATRNNGSYAMATGALGTVFAIRGLHNEALASYGRAISIYVKVGRGDDVARIHHNMGMVYRDMGLYAAAATHFQDALDFARSRELFHEVAYIEVERSLLLLQVGEQRLALKTAARGFDIARSLRDVRIEGEALRALGAIALATGECGTAADYLQRSLSIARETQTKLLQAEVLELVAHLQLAEGNSADAAHAAKASAELFGKMGATSACGRVLQLVSE